MECLFILAPVLFDIKRHKFLESLNFFLAVGLSDRLHKFKQQTILSFVFLDIFAIEYRFPSIMTA